MGLDVITPREHKPWPLRVVDGSDYGSMLRELAGAAAVCHVGEIPNMHRRNGEVVYARNTAAASGVMQAAVDQSVPRIIYASSCQAYGCWGGEAVPETMPVTERQPLHPFNAYAASKAANEHYLAMLVRSGRVASGVAVRMPSLIYSFEDRYFRHSRRTGTLSDGFNTWLQIADAAMLFIRSIEVSPAGFHGVHGCAPKVDTEEPIAKRIAETYPNFPPLPDDWPHDKAPMDYSATTALIGWEPIFSEKLQSSGV